MVPFRTDMMLAAIPVPPEIAIPVAILGGIMIALIVAGTIITKLSPGRGPAFYVLIAGLLLASLVLLVAPMLPIGRSLFFNSFHDGEALAARRPKPAVALPEYPVKPTPLANLQPGTEHVFTFFPTADGANLRSLNGWSRVLGQSLRLELTGAPGESWPLISKTEQAPIPESVQIPADREAGESVAIRNVVQLPDDPALYGQTGMVTIRGVLERLVTVTEPFVAHSFAVESTELEMRQPIRFETREAHVAHVAAREKYARDLAAYEATEPQRKEYFAAENRISDAYYSELNVKIVWAQRATQFAGLLCVGAVGLLSWWAHRTAARQP